MGRGVAERGHALHEGRRIGWGDWHILRDEAGVEREPDVGSGVRVTVVEVGGRVWGRGQEGKVGVTHVERRGP